MARNYVFFALNIVNIINIVLVILNLLPNGNWWLSLVVLNLAGVTGAVYFIEIFGIKRGCIFVSSVFILFYLLLSQARLLPFVTDNSLYAQVIYLSMSAQWLASMAIVQAFTYRKSFAVRSVLSLSIILFIQFFLTPVIARFSRFETELNQFFQYQIKLSGYLVIIGLIIIFQVILLICETLWLVNYSEIWKKRMHVLFFVISGIPILFSLKYGLWQTSILCLLIMCSLIVVANSKMKGDSIP